jgi:6,7-dimethyl-8-ribityllumazine synthase
MLKRVKAKGLDATGDSFAIVASRYNAVYVDAMVRAAKAELQNAGARIRIVRVPGAFEIPTAAARLAEKNSGHASRLTPVAPKRGEGGHPASRLSAILCLGVVFQGETSHARHIGWGVTHALAQIQVRYKIPVIHAVFVFEKEKHARVRCLGTKHNRGTEAAQTALQMARVMKSLA